MTALLGTSVVAEGRLVGAKAQNWKSMRLTGKWPGLHDSGLLPQSRLAILALTFSLFKMEFPVAWASLRLTVCLSEDVPKLLIVQPPPATHGDHRCG